jgi:hypothetical protein
MGVPTSEIGYTSVTIGRGGHEVHKGHVVALEEISSSSKHRLMWRLDLQLISIVNIICHHGKGAIYRSVQMVHNPMIIFLLILQNDWTLWQQGRGGNCLRV